MRKDNKFRAGMVFVYRLFDEFGINGLKMWHAVSGVVPYVRDALVFSKEKKLSGIFSFPRGVPFLCLGDRFEQSGSAQGAYFHQDLWVAQQIFWNHPEKHVDVGSRIDGFVAHVASFREIDVLDVRPLDIPIKNVHFHRVDMMLELKPYLIESCDSLSCLHALEHFGLGRYGDPVRRDGFLVGWNNLYRILRSSGTLYFSVPMGSARIEFNAHRVFSVEQLLLLVEDKYEISSFSYIDDSGIFFEEMDVEKGRENNFGCHFGCAVMELRKR